jgi:thioredoxin-like negative regulator of GroEL
MDSSPGSSIKFWIIAVLALGLGTTALAALWPLSLASAHRQSAALVTAGRSANGGEALTDFQLASWLDPANQAAYAGLAASQIRNGQPAQALANLARAGRGAQVSRLQVRTLIELGRNADAAAAASKLTAAGADDSDLVLASLAFAQMGRTSDVSAILPRIGSPEALSRVKRAQSGKLTLAAELSSEGLLNSSSVILNSLPPTFERNLMLARIEYVRHTSADLTQAVSLLNQAISINPADRSSRRLLSDVYTEQGNFSAATHQTELTNQLQAGRP